jgi:uncharacterized protein involved in exopolysaccharide biosynthesis
VFQGEPIYAEQVAGAPGREVNVLDLVRIAWRQKLIVAITAALFTAVALYVALTATPQYRGEVVIAGVRESGMGGLGAVASGLGGLASLAGVNLSESSQDLEHQAVLESRLLVEEFIKRDGVLQLMAKGAQKPPTLWFAVEQFRKGALTITPDKLKGVTTVSIEWTDPATAARWANDFVQLANELIRKHAIDDASRNIDYLNKQIARTNVLEVQRVMYDLIEQQTKTLMLANGRTEYAFTIVDPAVTPEKRVSPRRTLIVISGLVVGVLVGAVVGLLYDARRRRLAQRTQGVSQA